MKISLYPGNYDGIFTDSRFRFGCDWSIENEDGKNAFLFDTNFFIVNDQKYFEKINQIISCEDDVEADTMIMELEEALSSDEDVAEIFNEKFYVFDSLGLQTVAGHCSEFESLEEAVNFANHEFNNMSDNDLKKYGDGGYFFIADFEEWPVFDYLEAYREGKDTMYNPE